MNFLSQISCATNHTNRPTHIPVFSFLISLQADSKLNLGLNIYLRKQQKLNNKKTTTNRKWKQGQKFTKETEDYKMSSKSLCLQITLLLTSGRQQIHLFRESTTAAFHYFILWRFLNSLPVLCQVHPWEHDWWYLYIGPEVWLVQPKGVLMLKGSWSTEEDTAGRITK